MASTEGIARRRAALAGIFESVSTEMVERVVEEAVRATRSFGLTGEVAVRYGERIRGAFVPAMAALTEIDQVERDRKMHVLVAAVRRVSEDHHVPRIIERGLIGLAFGFARGLVLSRTVGSGFTRDEIDAEFICFRNEFQKTLYQWEEANLSGDDATAISA